MKLRVALAQLYYWLLMSDLLWLLQLLWLWWADCEFVHVGFDEESREYGGRPSRVAAVQTHRQTEL